jgi:hypothetical protein
MDKSFNVIGGFTIFLYILLLLLGIVKGGLVDGRLDYQTASSRNRQLGGPFESSGSTSRYALTEAMVEDKTIFLNEEKAGFASPDVSESEGKYFSLFNPGVSIVGVPFYILGKKIGIPQLAAYFSSILFSAASVLLIVYISAKLGFRFYTGLLAGLVYLFGTNALSYSLTYTQHPLSSFLVLLATCMALQKSSWLSYIFFALIYGIGIIVDVPNAVIMFPLVIYLITKEIYFQRSRGRIKVTLGWKIFGLLAGLVPMLVFFGWYNHQLTGSYTRMPQFVGRSQDFWSNNSQNEPVEPEGANIPFKTRNLVQSLNIFFFSSERGIPYYSPIVLLGIFGFYIMRKKRAVNVIAGVFLANLVIYSLFNDATGSWSFGPRYLLPGLAILSIGIPAILERFSRSVLFTGIFALVLSYSVFINVMGAMTTTLVPPRVEAVSMAKPIPYDFRYNWNLMTEDDLNGSLIFNTFILNGSQSEEYVVFYTSSVLALFVIVYFAHYLVISGNENKIGKGNFFSEFKLALSSRKPFSLQFYTDSLKNFRK